MLKKAAFLCALAIFLFLPASAESSRLGRIIGDVLSGTRVAQEPLGTIALFRDGRAPVGWQPCDGRWVFGNSPLRHRMKRTPKIDSERKGYGWWIRTL